MIAVGIRYIIVRGVSGVKKKLAITDDTSFNYLLV